MTFQQALYYSLWNQCSGVSGGHGSSSNGNCNDDDDADNDNTIFTYCVQLFILFAFYSDLCVRVSKNKLLSVWHMASSAAADELHVMSAASFCSTSIITGA